MGKIRVRVADCTLKDILAENVIGKNGIMLVASETCMTDYIKSRLIQTGIKEVSVYSSSKKADDKESKKKLGIGYAQSILTARNLLYNINLGRKISNEEIIDAVDGIHSAFNVFEDKDIIECIAKIKKKDEYTYCHSLNTALYCMLLAKWLGLGNAEIKKAIEAGLLHDVGKSRIPKRILNKKGPLTNEELKVIRTHTIHGYNILRKSNINDIDVANAVLLHHERLDRSGYPFRLTADKQSVYVRIVAIADVYDAVTSDRVYKPKATPFEAFRVLQNNGMGNFDVKIMRVFINHISAHLVGIDVKLSDGVKGKIAYISPHDTIWVVVKTDGGYVFAEGTGNVRVETIL